MVIKWKIKSLQVYGDSQLVICQVNDDYDTKGKNITPQKHIVDSFRLYFDNITFYQVPRIQNKVADAMETIGSLLDIPNNVSQFEFLVEQLLIPTFYIPESEMVYELVGSNSPWYQEIYDCLHDHIISLDLFGNQHKTFIHKASKYTITNDTLYR